MSAIPDFLYRLTHRDMQVTPLEIYTTRQSGTNAATSVNTGSITVPLGKVFVMTTCSMVQQSAGVANCQSAYIQAYIDSLNPIEIASMRWPTFSTTESRFSASPMAYIPEGWTIKGTAKWDAALAGNNIYMMLSGVLIPRGNFAV